MKISRRKSLRQHAITRAGPFVVWLALMGSMFLAYQNSNAFLAMSSDWDSTYEESGSTIHASQVESSSQTERSNGIDDDPNENLIVGIMFAGQQKYLDSLKAQSKTWLSSFPRERVFAVGPANTI